MEWKPRPGKGRRNQPEDWLLALVWGKLTSTARFRLGLFFLGLEGVSADGVVMMVISSSGSAI